VFSLDGSPEPPKNMLTANERLASKLINIASRSEASASQPMFQYVSCIWKLESPVVLIVWEQSGETEVYDVSA
jgi:hypothetical protein